MTFRLSPREIQVVEMLANGQSSKQIMLTLEIKRRTYKKYLEGARRKTRAETREQLVAICVVVGIVTVIMPAEEIEEITQ